MRLSNMSIGARINTSLVVVISVLVIAIISFMLRQIDTLINEAEKRELTALKNNIELAIQSEGRLASAMASLVADLPQSSQAITSNNRDILQDMFLDGFSDFKKSFGVAQFQFHTPPATSFYRVHKPEKFGDDLSSFRPTVITTNKEKRIVTGLDMGVAGLGIRGIAPIFETGTNTKHVGSVEFGMSFGQSFVDNIKQQYGVDLGIYLNREGKFTPHATTYGDNFSVDTQTLEASFGGNINIINEQLNGIPVAILTSPIKDYDQNTIGVLAIALERENYLALFSNTRNIAIVIGIIGLAISVLASLLIVRSVTGRIYTLQNQAQNIKNNKDLTISTEVTGQDELATLGDAVNNMISSFRETLAQISQASNALTGSSEVLSHTATTTSQSVIRQQNETHSIATAMQEMTTSIIEVARHTAEAAQKSSAATTESLGSAELVKNMIKTINHLSVQLTEISELANRLSKDSDSIGVIIEVIDGISEQTNLLALNAAIEAARAGESGRGFAVVADEVRSLASKTKDSTSEIHTMIAKIQNGTTTIVEKMQLNTQEVEHSVSLANQTTESLISISNHIAEINDMNIQIASATKQQEAVAEELARNINNVGNASDNNAESAKLTLDQSKSLKQLSDNLNALISEYRI